MRETRKFRFEDDCLAMEFWTSAAIIALEKSEGGMRFFSGSQSGSVVEIECFVSVMPKVYREVSRMKGVEITDDSTIARLKTAKKRGQRGGQAA